MRFINLARLAPVVLVFFALSCAEVEIRKIGPDGEAVGPEGMRFYLPRPYVAVNEPFIVGGEAYLVGGEITPDGKYVLINDIDRTKLLGAQHFVNRFLATTGKTIPATSVIAADGGGSNQGGQQQSAAEEDAAARKAEEAKKKKEEDELAAGAKGEGDEGGKDPVKEKTGLLSLKIANDNSAYAVTPLKRYFDILWLPDFEEQYVVHGEAGMGNASIAMQMGQGWSLQGLEATVDNSAITGRIFGLIDQGTEMLSTLGRAQLGLPPTKMGGEQSVSETPNAAKFSGGTPLTIKITFVRIAAPGLYPVLKPKEMANLPPPGAGVENRILVPVAPYTNIAFNTYEAVVVEAALATGDSALRLHQYIDLRPGDGTAGAGGGGGPREPSPEFWQDVSGRVSQQSGKKVTVGPKVDADELQVVIRMTDGTSVPQADRAAAEAAVVTKVDAILKVEAPAWNHPADVEFP